MGGRTLRAEEVRGGAFGYEVGGHEGHKGECGGGESEEGLHDVREGNGERG